MKILHISKKGTPQGDIDLTLAIQGKLIGIKGKGPPHHRFRSSSKLISFMSIYRNNKGMEIGPLNQIDNKATRKYSSCCIDSILND